MFDLDHFVWKYVHDGRTPNSRDEVFQIVAVEVGMPMEEVAWMSYTDQEIQRIEALMGLGIIVDPKRRRMRDQNIQFTAIAYLAA
jgi:hypothetical protein